MIRVIPTLYLMLSFFLFFRGSLGSMTDFVIRRAEGTRRGKVSNPTMRAKIEDNVLIRTMLSIVFSLLIIKQFNIIVMVLNSYIVNNIYIYIY